MLLSLFMLLISFRKILYKQLNQKSFSTDFMNNIQCRYCVNLHQCAFCNDYNKVPNTHDNLKSRSFPLFPGCGRNWIITAKRLLNPMLAFCDDEIMVTYLETNKESNVSLYQRFGFDLMETNQVPKSPVQHYSMVRQPK